MRLKKAFNNNALLALDENEEEVIVMGKGIAFGKKSGDRIDDEYDEEDHVIQKIDDNNYIVDGDVYLSDISEEAKINLESDSSETIGGFIIDILGEIPEDGDEDRELKFQNYIFTILSVKDRRIEKVKIEILPEDVESDSEDNDIDIE